MSGSIGCTPRQVAGAVQKPVLRAGGARQEHGALESLARPVQAYCNVIDAHPEGGGHLLARFATQIHAPQEVSILGLQRRQQRVEAGADRARELASFLGQGLLPGIAGFMPLACRFTTGIVRQHSIEQPGEPREDTFTLAEVERLADRAQGELLQHLLRSVGGAKMTEKDAQKIPAMCGQCRLNCGIQPLPGPVRCWLL